MNPSSFSVAGQHDVSLYPIIRGHDKTNTPFDKSSIKQINRTLYRIAVLCFKTLGDQILDRNTQIKLGDGQYKGINEIIQALQEIRTKISIGNDSNQLKAETACKKLFAHWSTSQSIDRAAQEMAADAFSLAPFPQEGLLVAEEFEKQAHDLIKERATAFNLLMRLVVQDPVLPNEENKTKETDEAINESDRILVAKLLNSWAALIQKTAPNSSGDSSGMAPTKRPIFFGPLLKKWAGGNRNRLAQAEAVYRFAGLSHWQSQQSDKKKSISDQAEEIFSFHDFLIRETIENLQEYLEIKNLTQETHIFLADAFKNENIRSDIAFFIANEKELVNIEWGKSQLESKHLLESFRWYFLILRRYSVAEENRALLFQRAIQRNRNEPLNILQPKLPTCSPRESKHYKNANSILERLLHSAPDKNNVQGAIFPLLHFCLGHENAAGSLAYFFEALHQLGVNFSAHQILQFCRMNKKFNSQMENRLVIISKFYIIQKLVDLNRFSQLFLNPPIEIDVFVLQALNGGNNNISNDSAESARPIITAYTHFMSRFISKERDLFWIWMRKYILRPCPLIFKFIDQASKWNRGEINQQFISLFFPPRDEFFQIRPTDVMLSRANDTILSLANTYSLSLSELFTLYLKAISFQSDSDYQPWRKAQRFIQKLSEFCPGVSGHVVVFLLLHYQSEAAKAFEQLDACKDQYHAMDRTRFFLNPKIMSEIHGKIEAFCELFSDNLSHEAEPFRRKLSEILKLSFTPFAQPITDFLKINNVTKERGIEWSEPYLATHEGSLKSVVENGPLKLYFHWQAIEMHPFLTLAAYDSRAKKGRWCTLQFPSSLQKLEKASFRNAIFSYLSDVAPQALNETTESIHQSYWEKYDQEELLRGKVFPIFETARKKISTQLETQVVSQEDLDAILRFIFEVKNAYRNIYWSLLFPKEQNFLPDCPLGEKILNGFFEDGSLISKKEIAMEPRGNYSIDFSEEELIQYQTQFFTPSFQSKEQSLCKMQVSLDGMTQTFFPIFLCVKRGVAFAKRNSFIRSDEDERKEPHGFDSRPVKLVQTQQEGICNLVILSVQISKDGQQESISYPLKYPEEAQNNRQVFKDLAKFHFALLKACVYFVLKRQKLLSSCIAPP